MEKNKNKTLDSGIITTIVTLIVQQRLTTHGVYLPKNFCDWQDQSFTWN
jgi:hypothetical protein